MVGRRGRDPPMGGQELVVVAVVVVEIAMAAIALVAAAAAAAAVVAVAVVALLVAAMPLCRAATSGKGELVVMLTH